MTGRVALVLGGSRGIGRDAARVLAREGWTVAVASRDLAACEDVAAGLGGDAVAFAADLTDLGQVETCVALAEARFGRVDGIFANAGKMLGLGELTAIGPEEFAAAVQLNMAGPWHAIRAGVPALARAGGGALVINTARSGLRGIAGGGAYSAAKAGAIMLAQVAAQEAGPLGVRVNAIAPGFIATDAWLAKLGERRQAMAATVPLRRVGEGADVAHVVAWLLSAAAAYVTGAVIPIDGGTTAG